MKIKLLFLILAIFLISCSQKIECPEPEPEKALLDVIVEGWALNEDDENDILINYFLYNYGGVEAKNVEVKCSIFDYKNDLIKTDIDFAGNIGSKSYSYNEMHIKNAGIKTYSRDDGQYKTHSLNCQVVDCDDCIILWKQIPRLKTYIEDRYSSLYN